MNKLIVSASLLLTVIATGPASAHHSAAMYEPSKKTTISGTVKIWQWTNPHAFLWLIVPDGKGGQTEAGFELGSPNTLIRNGFKSTTFKPGDKATVYFAPRRDGQPGGGIESVYVDKEAKWLQWGPVADAKAAQEAAEARAKSAPQSK